MNDSLHRNYARVIHVVNLYLAHASSKTRAKSLSMLLEFVASIRVLAQWCSTALVVFRMVGYGFNKEFSFVELFFQHTCII